MHALLLTCLSLLGAETRSITNSMNLIRHDWSASGFYSENVYDQASRTVTGTRAVVACEMLSFREDATTWDQGSAWKINYRGTGTSFSAVAFKGFYQIAHRDEQDVIVISLGFTKKYQASGPLSAMSVANWSLDTRFLPQGGHFALTLESGNRVPDTDLELSFERAFYVDEQGRETILRSSPYTFTERITGHGSIRTLRSPEFGTVGETLELTRGDIFQDKVELKMPPTFKPLLYPAKPHVVMKPAASTAAVTPPKAIDPAEAIFAKAKEAYEKADYRRAITLCTATLELSPALTSALKWRGYAFYELQDYVQAGRDLSAVIKQDPKDTFAYRKRAEAYLQLGYFSRGVADYTEHVRLSPDDPHALNSLAWTLATCSDSSVRNGRLALVHAEKACDLTAFKNADFIDTLAAACAETGDFTRAVRLQIVAVELAPDSWKKTAETRLKSYENRSPWRENLRRTQ